MICACALAMAAPAAGWSRSPQPHAAAVSVRVGDLDLLQAHGARRMLERLDAAAARACGASDDSLRDVKRAVRRSRCYRDAMDRAVAALGSAPLSALHRGRGATVASN